MESLCVDGYKLLIQKLSDLLDQTIGKDWRKNSDKMLNFEKYYNEHFSIRAY